jgi:hypothetical protein
VAPLYQTQVEREAYRNMMRAMIYTAKTEGLFGFYRGFLPMTITRIALHHIELQDAVRPYFGNRIIIKE